MARAHVLARQAHLWQDVRHELLPAEAGLHRHYEQRVELAEQIEVRLERRAWLHGQAGERARGADGASGLYGVPCRLDVEGDVRRARLRVAGRPAVRIVDHQVAV